MYKCFIDIAVLVKKNPALHISSKKRLVTVMLGIKTLILFQKIALLYSRLGIFTGRCCVFAIQFSSDLML